MSRSDATSNAEAGIIPLALEDEVPTAPIQIDISERPDEPPCPTRAPSTTRDPCKARWTARAPGQCATLPLFLGLSKKIERGHKQTLDIELLFLLVVIFDSSTSEKHIVSTWYA